MPEPREQRDVVLNPGEFAFIQDKSKGNINAYVGPHRTTISETDTPIVWDDNTKRYRSVSQDQAIQGFVTAREGSYIVLHNPALKPEDRPAAGRASSAVDLQQGRRIHLNGPRSFPLWPGEVASVVKGHQLRSNEYLVARVYNEDEARVHWAEAIMKPAAGEATLSTLNIDPMTLHIGQLLMIRGSEVSFFIPSTGIEVLRVPAAVDRRGFDGVVKKFDYIRAAVTLERLEYCILLNESGEKTYRKGPDVVFPDPSEEFVEDEGEVKFRATELSPVSGIHAKVIEEYTDEKNVERKVGEELFITGTEQPIFFPRAELATISYGKDAVHYAVAVPAGEGRYVLDRLQGKVNLVVGPSMLLVDPRTQVIVQRILDTRTVSLLFPGNTTAESHNKALALAAAAIGDTSLDYLEAGATNESAPAYSVSLRGAGLSSEKKQLVGTNVRRRTSFTPPRTVTLNTKYDGAVAVGPWVGFAIQVISKSGARRVVVGPATELLQYDESLTVMELSSGTPKTDRNPIKTVYLRVRNNRVSDIVDAETLDLVKVKISVAYRVNFDEASKENWFAVENYVRHLTEHGGSRIRGAVKKLGIEAFYASPISVIRDVILGASTAGVRPGMVFPENGMIVPDIEVIDVRIDNADIALLLTGAQHTAVRETLKIAQAEEALKRSTRQHLVDRQNATLQNETKILTDGIESEVINRKRDLELSRAESTGNVKQRERELEKALQPIIDEIKAAERLRSDLDAKQAQEHSTAELQAEAEALIARMSAISPQIVEVLSRFSDQDMLARLAEALAIPAILEKGSLAEVMGRYIEGTPMASVLANLRDRTPKLPRTAA